MIERPVVGVGIEGVERFGELEVETGPLERRHVARAMTLGRRVFVAQCGFDLGHHASHVERGQDRSDSVDACFATDDFGCSSEPIRGPRIVHERAAPIEQHRVEYAHRKRLAHGKSSALAFRGAGADHPKESGRATRLRGGCARISSGTAGGTTGGTTGGATRFPVAAPRRWRCGIYAMAIKASSSRWSPAVPSAPPTVSSRLK